MHPVHGPGKIINVQHQELVEGFKRYYVIQFITKKLTLLLPIRSVDEFGLRKIMSPSKVEQVFQILQEMPNSLPDDHKKRRKIIEELLHTGRPSKIAEAVRDLTRRQQSDGLSTSDNQLLSKGKDMLIAEITVVMDSQPPEARRDIDDALAQAISVKEIRG